MQSELCLNFFCMNFLDTWLLYIRVLISIKSFQVCDFFPSILLKMKQMILSDRSLSSCRYTVGAEEKSFRIPWSGETWEILSNHFFSFRLTTELFGHGWIHSNILLDSADKNFLFPRDLNTIFRSGALRKYYHSLDQCPALGGAKTWHDSWIWREPNMKLGRLGFGLCFQLYSGLGRAILLEEALFLPMFKLCFRLRTNWIIGKIIFVNSLLCLNSSSIHLRCISLFGIRSLYLTVMGDWALVS